MQFVQLDNGQTLSEGGVRHWTTYYPQPPSSCWECTAVTHNGHGQPYNYIATSSCSQLYTTVVSHIIPHVHISPNRWTKYHSFLCTLKWTH